MKHYNIAIFASGSGSNAENIINYFQKKECGHVSLILSNNKDAFVIERAKRLNVRSVLISNEELQNSDTVDNILIINNIDIIILAGFLLKIPQRLIEQYRDRIINIHPALLPKYGGKGMYGMAVHRAVIANGEDLSGITIHLVNEEYDKGKILFQASCPVIEGDTPESLVAKIHDLEQRHFPSIIETYLKSL